MDFRSIASYLGVMLEILGILALIPVIFSWIFGDGMHFVFLLTGIISFSIGTILDKRFQKKELNLGTAMVITALSFIIISLIGSLPYMAQLQPIDALFESVSGFTTTGLSVINMPELMPPSLIFWRSFTQWVGGVGILVIFILLMNSPGMSAYYLYKAEGQPERIEAGVKHSVRNIFAIYGFYTIAGILLLYFTGVPGYDSIVVAISSISTGGFAPNSASIAAYGNIWTEFIVIVLMIAGATSFFVHDRVLMGLLKGKLRVVGQRLLDYAKNPETKFFWILAVLFFILMPFALWGVSADPVRAGIFQAISAITTTGFSTVTIAGNDVLMFMIIILMIIGGYAGSTAGGIKLVRLGVVGKSFGWLGKKMSYPPESVIPFKLGKHTIKEHELAMIFMFICIYLALLVVSGILLVLMGYGPTDAFFQVSSAQGTVGFSTIDLAPMMWYGKLLLMANMMLGRLEIFPFLVLIYSVFNYARRKERY